MSEKNKDGCKVLCFYLPQFHRTLENDKWWGEGYTEWQAVKGAMPYYKGHVQPKEPLNGNYYDLSDESGKTWKWQSKLAGDCGIYGFVIYHYWFGGRKMLQKPAEILLRHPEIDIRYSFCWDNNEWRRNWYGTREEVLIPQNYGDEQTWKRHFEDLLPFFQDERYIKIDNKPVFHIYASSKIEKLSRMKECWNRLAKKNGFAGIYLIAGDLLNRKYQKCLDAYYNFEPNRIQVQSRYSAWIRPMIDFSGGIRKNLSKLFNRNIPNLRCTPLLYRLIVHEPPDRRRKTFRGLYVNYDDTPRRQEKGIIYAGGNPRLFRRTLRELLVKSTREGKEFLYVNAWNEWGEGAYLEPDKVNGYIYLAAVKRAVMEARQSDTDSYQEK